MRVGSDPSLFWQPWVGELFGYRHNHMDTLHIIQYVAMGEYLNARMKALRS